MWSSVVGVQHLSQLAVMVLHAMSLVNYHVLPTNLQPQTNVLDDDLLLVSLSAWSSHREMYEECLPCTVKQSVSFTGQSESLSIQRGVNVEKSSITLHTHCSVKACDTLALVLRLFDCFHCLQLRERVDFYVIAKITLL